MEQAQEPGEASRSEGFRRQVRGWFTSTGEPPAWGLVGYMVCGLVAGAALTGLLPDFRGTLPGALAGAIVAAAGSGGPSGISRRVVLIAAASGFLLMTIAFATGTHPVWAALAMAAVALLTSLGAAAGPLGSVLGFLLSLAYMLIATMARVTGDATSWAGHRLLDTLVGCAVALVATYLLWPRDRESESAAVPAPIT